MDDLTKFLKPGQTPLERMEQDHRDILALMASLQKEKETTEKLKWALQDAITTNVESCRQRDAANHRLEALEARLKEAGEAMKAVEPRLDAIICFASTQGEHEPNRIATAFRATLAKLQESSNDSGTAKCQDIGSYGLANQTQHGL